MSSFVILRPSVLLSKCTFYTFSVKVAGIPPYICALFCYPWVLSTDTRSHQFVEPRRILLLTAGSPQVEVFCDSLPYVPINCDCSFYCTVVTWTSSLFYDDQLRISSNTTCAARQQHRKQQRMKASYSSMRPHLTAYQNLTWKKYPASWQNTKLSASMCNEDASCPRSCGTVQDGCCWCA
jgi:cytochrome c oxidase assembly factor CtaG